jgi:hypothetical protein
MINLSIFLMLLYTHGCTFIVHSLAGGLTQRFPPLQRMHFILGDFASINYTDKTNNRLYFVLLCVPICA